jgi:hypothetical protein
MVRARLAERKATFDAYARDFDRTTNTQARTLVVAMVPGFALAVGLVGWRRRRGVVHHLVFALHTMAAVLLATAVLNRFVFSPGLALWQRAGLPLTSQGADDVVSLALSLALGTYFHHALRRAYGDGRRGAALKAFALVMAYWLVLWAYRALLFFVTFWTT